MPPVQALVVDDHAALSENIRDILEDGLEDLKLSCSLARSAAEALSMATADLEIALIDLHLPDASGTELIHSLHGVAPHAQVVIITGDSTVQSAIGALHEGAFGYVLKPFDAPALVDTVRRAVERTRLLRERETLRRELERSEQRYRGIIESVPALVLSLSPEGNISLWNRQLEELTGRPRQEMLGKPAKDFVPDAGDKRLPVNGGGYRIVRWQRADVPVAPESPPVTFAVGVDVTEEREMQRRAVRAERLAAVGTLAAGLAHEVRNPLNSASLQLQVLARRLTRGERELENLQPIIGLVQEEISRLDRLVSDFLAFARPIPLELEDAVLDDAITRLIELVRPECEMNGIELQVQLASDGAHVEIDPERLRQVFLNIVRNAVEAMGGSGTLSVRTHASDPAGLLAIEIEDTGPGFPEESPIFDAFYTTKEQGTGLGLAIVHSIVTEHGGTVSVAATGTGTCFTVRLHERARRRSAKPSDQ